MMEQNKPQISEAAQKQIETIAEKCERIKPLVVIRCITYNHEPYLRDALEGFVMQKTDFPFVAVVHEDASTDGTAAILREYADRYPDIILPIFETENQYSKPGNPLGHIMAKACNATGANYIAFCEGDDYWIDPLKLQKQIAFMESHPECIGCYGDVNWLNSVTGEVKERKVKEEGIPKSFEDHLMRKYYLAPPTWVYRISYKRQMRDYVDGTYARALDFMAISKFVFLDEVFAVYRSTPNGVSHVKTIEGVHKRQKGLWRTQRDFARRYPNLVSSDNKKKIKNHIFILMNMAILADDKPLLELCVRYAKYTRNFLMLVKYFILKTSLSKRFFIKRYKRSRTII